ncbi:MAG: DUF211 domain-containing protein [Caldivirga sp.]|jgi:hypothetical protein|uniref:DUF211 domain-containing protein n=1 Tax=Caldivirga sp. MU80 TaxID=1650354 RepID=UPI000747DADE|nr:DUF211 domain-containing protein [Caldivirga sp. MU80]KUO86263.1 MAG: hypothetical protein AT709_04400 [Caldivirga sp. MG_3]NAZ29119.1 hypothetical protein [Caldivirga sp.]
MSGGDEPLLRRVVLDVDAPSELEIIKLANELGRIKGVAAVYVKVEETDVGVLGLRIVMEGSIDFNEIRRVIEVNGAVIRSIDEVSVGEYILKG